MVAPYTAPTAKVKVREMCYDFLYNCKNIMTLPNLYFSLENELLKNRSVTCVERDIAIHNKQKKIAPKGIKLILGDITKAPIESYDGFFLDMCGFYSKSLEKVLNRIKPNSRVVITLLFAREPKNLQKKIDITKRKSSYKKLLKDRHNLITVDYYEYVSKHKMGVYFLIKQ
jgi:hypothetical protein